MQTDIQNTQTVTVRKTARGVRVWIEDTANNARLMACGFHAKARYDMEVSSGVIVLKLTAEGKRGVSGKQYPLIDISRKQLDGLEVDDQLRVVYRPGLITFTKEF